MGHERAFLVTGAPFLRLEMPMWAPTAVRLLTEDQARAAYAAMPPHAHLVKDASGRLVKSKEQGGEEALPLYSVIGIASAENVDLQNDTIKQAGLNWERFLSRGYINDDHGKTAQHIIGYPTKVYPTTVRDKAGKKHAATAIEGYLFNTPRATKLAQLAKAMVGTERGMGFSVEGPPPIRSAHDRRIIERADVEHLALTPWPVNRLATAQVDMIKSCARLAKSMSAGHPGTPGALQPLMPESLDGLASLTFDYERLRADADGWQPEDEETRRRRLLTKSEASALILSRFPQASRQAIERIIALAGRGA